MKQNIHESIIIGSGIAAFFCKKHNPSAIVISNDSINNSKISGGFVRTKGVENKSLIESVKMCGRNLNEDAKIKQYLNIISSLIKTPELFSESHPLGAKIKLNFLNEFQKDTINATVTKLLVENNQVQGVTIIENGKEKDIFAKSVILCTGGFAGDFKDTDARSYSPPNGIELAFQEGAIVKDLEFIQFHPFASTNRCFGTECLTEAKIFVGNKRELIVENILHDKRGHHLLSKMCSRLYKSKKTVRVDTGKIIFTSRPVAHYSCGGLVIDNRGMTSIEGLFAAGECTAGMHGADRIGGMGLGEAMVQGAISGKSSKIYSKNRKISSININLDKIKRVNSTTHFKKRKKDIFPLIQVINSKSVFKKGLAAAKKNKDYFYQAFFTAALKRKETRGCFQRSDFSKESKKLQKSFYFKYDKMNNQVTEMTEKEGSLHTGI